MTKTSFALSMLVVALSTSAYAVTTTMTASIRFREPLSMKKTSDIDFGFVSAGVADTYTISPDGSVKSTGKGEVLGSGNAAGSITISGSDSQAINILTTNYGKNNGVALQAASCSYGGKTASPCNLSGAPAPSEKGSTLKLGATIAVDGTQAEGSVASPSFDIVVAYQ